MPHQNLSFETEDVVALGTAESWTMTFSGSDFEAADFLIDASTPLAPLETFRGGWDNDGFAFNYPANGFGLAFGVFDSDIVEPYEDFEEEWANSSFFYEMAVTVTASFDGEDFEDFEENWGIASYQFVMGATTAGTFDGEAFEDFEEGWGNSSYQFTMGSTTAAVFDTGPVGAAEAVEDFEEVCVRFLVAPDHSSDSLIKVSHGLSDGMVIQLENENGALPTGLSDGTDYFVDNAAPNFFEILVTSGGAQAVFSDNGTGQLYVLPDPRVFWTYRMLTL